MGYGQQQACDSDSSQDFYGTWKRKQGYKDSGSDSSSILGDANTKKSAEHDDDLNSQLGEISDEEEYERFL